MSFYTPEEEQQILSEYQDKSIAEVLRVVKKGSLASIRRVLKQHGATRTPADGMRLAAKQGKVPWKDNYRNKVQR